MNTAVSYPLLEQINSPADLRKLSEADLPSLAKELRDYLISSISQTGGHLASNLGCVELTIALHYVFDTPQDRLVWDVGHQSYPHKILTGRRDALSRIRQAGGISGFPKRSESEYDTFGVGHSSTSIGAALGMAMAKQIQGDSRKAVAIIGDGAMTAGMAFEALNHAGGIHADMLIILNDNEMSISPNVGALKYYLARILSSEFYTGVREGGKKLLQHVPSFWEFAKRTEEHMKGMLIPGTLFEEFGCNYIGPLDGHDLPTLLRTLRNVRELKGPQFLHIVTRKGKGFKPAENNPCAYHGVGQFDPATGELRKKATTPTYTQVFGQWLCDMAAADERLVGITPAMREGSGLVEFSERYPERYVDVGIAEQHSVTLAAGMACEGLKPVVAIYSTFLQRAYDQLLHDVALQNLPVLFAIDRAGLVGADGPTHAGSFDLSFLRCVPNMLVMAPADENECRQMLTTGFHHDGPAAVRYPRGTGPGIAISEQLDSLPIGKAMIRRQGKSGCALLVFGTLLSAALEAAEALDATVVNMRFIKPLDEDMIRQIAASHQLLVTVEENAVQGGAGSAINEFVHHAALKTELLNLGLPDRFLDHGDVPRMLADCGLDALGIQRSIRQRLALLAAEGKAPLRMAEAV